jgi:serine/threonine protein phosphatase PrpC
MGEAAIRRQRRSSSRRRFLANTAADDHIKDQAATTVVTTTTASDNVEQRKQQQPAGDTSLGWNFRVGCASLAGTDPDRPQKVNQDGYFVLQGHLKRDEADKSDHDHVQVICALDGHGLKGHLVVQYLQRQLARIVAHRLGLYETATTNDDDANNDDIDATKSSSEALWGKDRIHRQVQELETWGLWNRTEEHDAESNAQGQGNTVVVKQALMDSFLAAQRSAQDNPAIPSSRSGTTCILATVIATTATANHTSSSLDVYTATVGDSHAIAITIPPPPAAAGGPQDALEAWTVQPLSMPTTTMHMASERARIQASEGRIDDSGNVWYGPMGIAMTRSLGNSAMLRAGILPVPIVTRHSLPRWTTQCKGNDGQSRDHEPSPLSYLVCVGTDGVFDVLSHKRIVDILQRATVDESLSLDEAAAEVCRQARLAWLADLPMETKVDDATFVILQCVPKT